MQVKTGFNIPIFHYILPFLYKIGMISIIYHNYDESFFETIPPQLSYAVRIPLNSFLI